MSALARALAAFWAAFAPPPRLTVSQWADANRFLSRESAAEPGQWRTDRAEYQRGIMDALNDPNVEGIVVMTSAQVGKTSILENVLGFHVHQDPAPILVLQPTLEMAEAFSKDRLAPMLRDCPALRGRVQDVKARTSGNTLLHKTFPGGHITLAGANSPAALASRPIRVVLCDEVDRYPESAGTEGDPVSLAFKRTATFWNRRKVLFSTPTVKGASRIEKAWEGSDRRRFWVPCPHCGTEQVLQWKNVVWPEGKPELAVYACSGCGVELLDGDRVRMIRRGRWIAEAPGAQWAGFHLNEMYSPWRRLSEIAGDFLQAKRTGVEALKTWINTSLGETWDPRDGATLSADGLMGRREVFAGQVPGKVAVVTVGADVQDDRIEVTFVGWGAGEESWTLRHEVIYGNLATSEPWDRLEAMLREPLPCEGGRSMRVKCAAVDSGGHFTKQVYAFCRRPGVRGLALPIKGASTPLQRAVQRSGKKAALWSVDVNALKDQFFARLKIAAPGPGFCHFSQDFGLDYFEQLTSEKLTRRRANGMDRRVYEKVTPNARNEGLDCQVYAAAALAIFNPRDLGAMVHTEAPAPPPEPEPKQVEPEAAEPPPPPRRKWAPRATGGGWSTGGGWARRF